MVIPLGGLQLPPGPFLQLQADLGLLFFSGALVVALQGTPVPVGWATPPPA